MQALSAADFMDFRKDQNAATRLTISHTPDAAWRSVSCGGRSVAASCNAAAPMRDAASAAAEFWRNVSEPHVYGSSSCGRASCCSSQILRRRATDEAMISDSWRIAAAIGRGTGSQNLKLESRGRGNALSSSPLVLI